MQQDLIFDVGMHIGNDTAYYLSRGYRVVAIEADPSLVAEQKAKHAEHIRSGRLTILNYVIGSEDGTTRFWICQENRAMSTMDESIMRSSRMHFEPTDLPCRTLSSIFREHGVPFYLKIDIEGSDHYCLRAIDPTDAPTYVSFEMLQLSDLFLLHSKGYDAFKCIDQDTLMPLNAQDDEPDYALSAFKTHLKQKLQQRPWLDRMARGPLALRAALIRRQPRPVSGGEGDRPVLVHNGWSFLRGATGPFGEESSGHWRPLDDVAYAWLSWRRRMPGRAGWFDIHATRTSTTGTANGH